MIENLFPEIILTEADEMEVLKAFSNPSVIKYLKKFGQGDSSELLTLSTLDLPAEGIARRHSYVAGKLAVVTTLLSIPAIPERKQS